MKIEHSPEYRDALREYGVFNPDNIVQTVFQVVIDRDTASKYKSKNLDVPDRIITRLRRNEAYVTVQIRRWGIEAINDGCDMIVVGHPQWGEIRDLFPSDTGEPEEDV